MIKTLIVDDERLARAELKRLLAAHPHIEICAEAASSDEAKKLLAELPIELVFLDIQMPGMTGLELAAQLHPQLHPHLHPHLQFVFCTAFDSYALNAFELNALDYLVKPIDPDRLGKTLQRLANKPMQQDTANYLPETHGLLLKFGECNRIVRLSEINRFESIGNHSAVYTHHGKSFLHSSLSKIEQRLDPQQFFRTSRADIVRVSAIRELEAGLTPGSMLAVLQDGQTVEVSRRQVQVLRNLFGGI